MNMIDVYLISVAVIGVLAMGVPLLLSLFPSRKKSVKRESSAWKVIFPLFFGVLVLGFTPVSALTALDVHTSSADAIGYWYIGAIALVVSGGFFAMATMAWRHARRKN